MSKLGLQPARVFHYFEELSAIPRGSQNMDKISAYCEAFAEKNGLKAVRDAANNVIIYKPAAPGYEQSEPILLQGHLDMVCQKTEESSIDFEKDGLDLYVDGDYLKARGTTLGADNGIAVAMVLAVLEDRTLEHPALEAVFTTDEEIGMIGAGKLDFSLLSAKKMINLDSEEIGVLTVSCAGGSDFQVRLPLVCEQAVGAKVTLTVKGLLGGHSGVEIHKGRINAARLGGMFLKETAAQVISFRGGDKANAIPNQCRIELCVTDPAGFERELKKMRELTDQLRQKEPGISLSAVYGSVEPYAVWTADTKELLIGALTNPPDGVVAMSPHIEGLAETSLNLGIVAAEGEEALLHFALRSNKEASLCALEDELKGYFAPEWIRTFGHYPPWEFKEDSALQQLYKTLYKEEFGREVRVEAIHAGLECGVFSAGIRGLDCIAVGPQMEDVHTVNERLSISSVRQFFALLVKILKASR